MSAASNPLNPSPSTGPGGAQTPEQRSELPWAVKAGGLAVVVLALAWGGYRYLAGGAKQKTVSANVIPTVKATSGSLNIALRVAGSTAAQDYVSVRAPMQRGWDRMDMTLQYLVPSGKVVHKGEVIAQIENRFLQDRMDDNQASLLQSDMDLKKLLAQQAVDMETLRQSLRQAKSTLDKAELDFRTTEIRTDIDRELLKLSVDEARASYQEQERDLKNQELVQKAALRIQQIGRRQMQTRIDRQKNDFERFTVRAPIDGLAVTESVWRRGEQQIIREGDQVGSGQPIVKIVNPASMIIEAVMNQSASTMLRIGQEAQIAVDAFPGMSFKGHVYSVGALAVSGSMQNNYVRTIPVKIKIEGTDPRLIPDLSASADIQVKRSEVATLLPRAAVVQDGGKPVVYVKSGQHFQKRPVEIGLQNNLQASITSGLEPGEVVRLFD